MSGAHSIKKAVYKPRRESAMPKAAGKWLMVAAVITSLTASGWAEEVDAGKTEYLSNCATCHGSDGKGKGPTCGATSTACSSSSRPRPTAAISETA
jgi:mono/diheme cytochrome c family protein